MKFDQFSVVLLSVRRDVPEMEPARVAELREGHLGHLADLHEAGYLLAAGPLAFDDEDEDLCGLSLFRVDVQTARELAEEDPAVRGGMFAVKALPWMVPSGAMHFTQTRLPRSSREALGLD